MRRRLVSLAVLLTVALAGTLPASADTQQATVVTSDPVDWTPHVLDGTVRAIVVVGENVVVGGEFKGISDDDSKKSYRQPYLFAFNRRTGRLRGFAPDLDGPVYALAAGPNGSVIAGGAFRSVNGSARRGLARIDLTTGELSKGFKAGIGDGDVRTLAVNGNWLYAGGSFASMNGVPRVALARLDARTGALDTSFDAQLAAPELSRTKIEDLAVSPDGRQLVVIGALTRAAGQIRAQLAMIDTSVSPARLSAWYTNAYTGSCYPGFETYLRGVDFSPDGQWFVVVTTGRLTGPDLMCDTANRFEATGTGEHKPTWVNHTGGDSLYSVSVTGAAVYVGGHQRWMDNPEGNESAGPGAVSRTGIAALDPVTGKALPWNPTKSRGVGVRALVAVPEGLYVGSDTERLANEYHARIGMFPLA